MKNLIFFQDSIINKEIAFILKIDYKFIDNFNKNEYKMDKIFVSSEEDKQILLNNGLIEDVDYISFHYLCDYLNQFNRDDMDGRTEFFYTLEDIDKVPLKDLSLGEMLIKVLYSKKKNIPCDAIERLAYLNNIGDLWACCETWTSKPLGNVLKEDAYDNYYARMIQLSSFNKTFCFCDLTKCLYYGVDYNDDGKEIEIKNINHPKELTVAIDRVCNLRCQSCRKNYYVPSTLEKQTSRDIADKLLELEWLNMSDAIIAGQGEVFLSPNYLKLLRSDNVSGRLCKILSNGVLFNESKLEMIKQKYNEIQVFISIDAASSKTYRKLRNGNFDLLLKNLKMLGDYRAKNEKLTYYQINFVVQKDNMHEILDFVKLGKEVGVNCVYFTKLNDWGTYDNYDEVSLVIDDHLDYDLYKILTNPIMDDEIVDLSIFKNYIDNSRKIYES